MMMIARSQILHRSARPGFLKSPPFRTRRRPRRSSSHPTGWFAHRAPGGPKPYPHGVRQKWGLPPGETMENDGK